MLELTPPLLKANLKQFLGIYEKEGAERPAVQLSAADSLSLLKLVAPSCQDYVISCLWRKETVPCRQHLQLVPTDIGFCCSFNIELGKTVSDQIEESEEHHEELLASTSNAHSKYNKKLNCSLEAGEDENEENGCPYTDSDEEELCLSKVDIGDKFMEYFCEEFRKLPAEQQEYAKVRTVATNQTQLKTVAKAGKGSGFSFLFDSLRCETIGKLDFFGLKMLVHHPQEFPRVGEKGFPVTIKSETYVKVEAEVLKTQPDVIHETPEKRQCLFPHEKKLLYYNAYSKPRCELECEIPQMVKSCGCAPYFMPGNSPVCPADKASCAEDVSEHPDVLSCKEGCLSSCDEIIYHTSASSAKFPSKSPEDIRILAEASKDNPSVKNGDYVEDVMGMVHVYFKDDSVKKYTRSLRYSTIDLVSSVGGTMGLCLGFSLVSVVEMLYFLTLRR